MDRFFVFGGMKYKILERKVLRGMSYYHVLENVITGDRLYLLCMAE